MAKPASSIRRSLLAAIHIEAKNIGLDQESRRAMQERLTGHESCKEMNIAQLNTVLDHLRDKPKAEQKRSARRVLPEARARKVLAMWKQLSDEGVVTSAGYTSLDNFVYRQTQISALPWVRKNHHFDALMTALRGMAARHNIRLHEKR